MQSFFLLLNYLILKYLFIIERFGNVENSFARLLPRFKMWTTQQLNVDNAIHDKIKKL